jgi:glucosyl-dolichyl phosphate glucuronosyltransferase
MNISVVLCTYNRCGTLGPAIASILASKLVPSLEWELVIVDNNSKDKTRPVIEDFVRNCPGRVRYLLETKQGLSHARNAGIDAARGEVIAFTDDDVTVEPDWLENLTSPLLGQKSRWAGAAGRIRQGENFSPPSWLPLQGPFGMGGAIVQFDEGENQTELKRAPFGANMAFRKAMFEKYGKFRTDLGRSAGSLIGNEDTEFGERLMSANERLCYVPDAVVHHPVPPERLTKKYIRSYWFFYGRSLIRQTNKRRARWKVPLHFLRQLKRQLQWMFVVDRLWPLHTKGRFYCEATVCRLAGEMVETYNLSKGFK